MFLRLFYSASSILFWLIPEGIWINEIRPGQQSLYWLKIPAVVISHQDMKVVVARGSAPALRILYDYVYLDKHYENDLVRFSAPDRGVKFEYGLAYPVGKSVWVYINPNQPTQTVLEPGVQEISLDFFWLGTLLALIVSGLSIKELSGLNRLRRLNF
ncbi:DUF3592 domain-containing protein [Deinococcus sp.]|uniref:DUF3592 domain-containing protein n=1 Tax=Deinococcus sp. TaxID=47478 RepID=UPI003C7A639D